MVSDYNYVPGHRLPHGRKVEWYSKLIARAEMSQGLQRSTGAIGTVSNISKHKDEVESFLAGHTGQELTSTDEQVEDPSAFALEKHLEDFLVKNWSSTTLGETHKIFEDEGEPVGQQYPTDTGEIDILAVSKDGKELLVVELKKGRASDAVVGQVQRYMGFVLDELAEQDQAVRGCIIAFEEDLRLKRALRVISNINLYRYELKFSLFEVAI